MMVYHTWFFWKSIFAADPRKFEKWFMRSKKWYDMPKFIFICIWSWQSLRFLLKCYNNEKFVTELNSSSKYLKNDSPLNSWPQYLKIAPPLNSWVRNLDQTIWESSHHPIPDQSIWRSSHPIFEHKFEKRPTTQFLTKI